VVVVDGTSPLVSIHLRGLRPAVRSYAEHTLAWARYYDIPVQVTSTLRSWTDQQALYDRYLAGESRWPANPPGQSAHNYGLAWDSVSSPDRQADWNWLRRALGWHVPESDEIHAAVPEWRRYANPRTL